MSSKELFERIIALQGDHPAEAQLDGEVLATQPKHSTTTTDSGINETHQVVFKEDVPEGFFKPVEGLDTMAVHWFGLDREHVAANECAAWQLARILGEPYCELIAPVIFREITIEPGSDNERTVQGVISQDRGRADWDAAVSDGHDQLMVAGFFDALIGQQDRHKDQHAWRDDQLYLFDHGFAFSGSTRVRHKEIWALRRRHEPALRDEEQAIAKRISTSPDLLGIKPLLIEPGAERMRRRAAAMADTGKMPATV